MKLTTIKFSIQLFAKSFPLERRRFLRRFESRLTRENAALIFEQLLSHIATLYFTLTVEQKALALELLSRICKLAGDQPIMLPAVPETLVQLLIYPTYKLRASERQKPLGNFFNFIGGCFCKKRIEIKEARCFAVYLRLIGFDKPIERATNEQLEEAELLNPSSQQLNFKSQSVEDIVAKILRGTYEAIDAVGGHLWQGMIDINLRLPHHAGDVGHWYSFKIPK